MLKRWLKTPISPAIWQYDRKQRPGFTSICTTLEEISQTEFVNLGDSDFSTLRLEWQDELDMIYRDIQEKEDKLYQREEEVRTLDIYLHDLLCTSCMYLVCTYSRLNNNWRGSLRRRCLQLFI